MQLSVVIPCLNEIETLGICISKCLNSFKMMNVEAEVLIADNGSTDGSKELALNLGARVVSVKNKGYGNALISGIKAAKGKYIIMGDADDSYNFEKINSFYEKLLDGYEMVQGCRFSVGGGKIEKNAMPVTHKYLGNPFFSTLSKLFFSLPFNDVYCGYRGFLKSKFLELDHFSGGMVFAIENLIKFKTAGAKCTEIPVTLHKDGRKKNKSHLNTLSDGWNTLRFLLVTCPKWLYFFPSIIFLSISILSAISLFLNHSNSVLDINVFKEIISTSIFFLLGFQFFMFGLFSSLIATKLKMQNSRNIKRFFNIFKIRYAFILSASIIIAILIDHNFYELLDLKNHFKVPIYYYGCFFSILLLINSFFVSLITLDEQ
ncbi:glycosyltransferase family 2 protein [Candidatus Pelagibacter sp.]|nr:glycosyltransferase family 2 protein [Candidatus Pelagibacter sp.]